MKLSALSTDQLADVLIAITPPLCRIIRDPRTLAALDSLAFDGLDAQPPMKAFSILAEALIPILLQHHAADFYALLSALTGKQPKTLRSQPGLTTLTDLMEVWDGQLTAFFTFAGSARPARSSASSPPPGP